MSRAGSPGPAPTRATAGARSGRGALDRRHGTAGVGFAAVAQELADPGAEQPPVHPVLLLERDTAVAEAAAHRADRDREQFPLLPEERSRSRRARSAPARKGLSPPVDTATQSVLPRARPARGRGSGQCWGRSTTLRSTPRSSASVKLRRWSLLIVLRRVDGEEPAGEVPRSVVAASGVDRALGPERLHLGARTCGEDGDPRSGADQAARLLRRQRTAAEDRAGPVPQS